MTPFDSPSDAADALESTLALLDEAFIQRVVDQPIDLAAVKYRPSKTSPTPLSFDTFLGEVSQLVSHLYSVALTPPRVLTGVQARKEALYLLENFYDPGRDRAYEAAYVDCLREGPVGMRMMFLRITGALKALQRHRYVQWILTSRVRSQGWQFRRSLIVACLNQYGDLLPREIRNSPPERFVAECHTLVERIAAARNELRSRLGGFWSE